MHASPSNTPLAFDDEAAFVRLGLILLATDLTTEQDFALMARACDDPRLRLHATRVAYANPVTPENLRAMGPRLGEAAALLAPDTPLQTVYFSCTSGSAVIGDHVVEAAVRSAKGENTLAITPLTAAMAACTALGVSRLSMLTPYTEESTRPVVGYFTDHGVDVCNVAYLGLEDDREMARIAPESLVAAALDAVAVNTEPGPDALFISCTALRSMQVAATIEEQTGLPVITSNQAATWMAFRTAGVDTSAAPFGRLMTRDLP